MQFYYCKTLTLYSENAPQFKNYNFDMFDVANIAFLYDFQLDDTKIGYGKRFFSTSGNSEVVFKVDENSQNGQNQGI